MNWKPVDVVVAILVAAISASILLTAIFPYVSGEPPVEGRTRLITGVITSIVAVISVYVGARIRERRKNEDDEDASGGN